MRAHLSKWISIALAVLAHGHQALFHRAMYCLNGTTPGVVDFNNNAPVQPLYMLRWDEFWLHAINGCDKLPPDPGVFMEIQAGGSLRGEIADNRAHTSLNPDAILTAWGDGKDHPLDYNDPRCITEPNLHTQNQSMAAGTAIAISYESDPAKATLDNFTVISVAHHTPWHREVEYKLPTGLPLCDPVEGCLCLWLWTPRNCGKPNQYLFPYKCKVISDGKPTKTIGKPRPPVYCEGNQTACVTGPKTLAVWHQAERNNIEVLGIDWDGLPKSPAYNEKCGFSDGPQTDIFEDDPEDGNNVTVAGIAALTASTIASGQLAVSPTSPASDPGSGLLAGSGTPTLPSSSPTSSLPTWSSSPAFVPASSLPAESSTPSLPASGLGSNLPTATGTPTLPASVPTSGVPTGTDVTSLASVPATTATSSQSSTPTDSTCSPSTQTVPATHSRRMIMRREKHNIF